MGDTVQNKDKNNSNYDIGRLDVELLEAFITVVDTNSFTQAAALLGRTQPSVSMQIKRLEERCGKNLFVRDRGRRLQLTRAGEDFFPYAKKVVELLDQARQVLLDIEPTSSIRIGLPERFSNDHLQKSLGSFIRLNRDLRLELVIDESHILCDMMKRGELDFVVALAPEDETGMKRIKTWREPFLWVAAENYIPPMYGAIPLALFDPPCLCRSVTWEALEQMDRPWYEFFSATRVSAVRGAILSGLAVSVLPAAAVVSGCKILTEKDGFVDLPAVELVLYSSDSLEGETENNILKYLTGYIDEVIEATYQKINLSRQKDEDIKEYVERLPSVSPQVGEDLKYGD